jgi:DNA-binding response OmpR family regulator
MGPKRLILVVEDHPSLRASVGADLTAAGFAVRLVSDYRAAVRVLAKVAVDLVLCDLTLPRESGFELIEHIRHASMPLRIVPIVVMSDRRSPEDMAHAEDVGANAFLKKPFTKDRLLRYIHALLDGPHSSRPSIRTLLPVTGA